MTDTPVPEEGFDLLLQRKDGSSYYRPIIGTIIAAEGSGKNKIQVIRTPDQKVAIHARCDLRWQLIRSDDPRYDLAHQVSPDAYHRAMRTLDLEPIGDPNE
jgi:hypothetical protein